MGHFGKVWNAWHIDVFFRPFTALSLFILTMKMFYSPSRTRSRYEQRNSRPEVGKLMRRKAASAFGCSAHRATATTCFSRTAQLVARNGGVPPGEVEGWEAPGTHRAACGYGVTSVNALRGFCVP